jgi:exonuclease III
LTSLQKEDCIFIKTKSLQLGLINACSVRNKYLDISDHVKEMNFDLCFMCETWLKPADRDVVAALKGTLYNFDHVCRENRVGGGIGLLSKKDYNVQVHSQNQFNSFESAEFKISSSSDCMYCVCIYRPPYSSNHPVTCSTFLNEFEEYLSQILTDYSDVIIVGDFNIHVNNKSCRDACKFLEILSSYGLVQHVSDATHKSGNTLDLIITTATSKFRLASPSVGYFVSDHAFVSSEINVVKTKWIKKTVSFRRYKDINEERFINDLSEVCASLLSSDENLADKYFTKLHAVLDRHAPVIIKRKSIRDNSPWFDDTARQLKSDRRKLERIWRQTREPNDYDNFQIAKQIFREYVIEKRSEYVNSRIEKCGRDSRKLYKEIYTLLDMKKENPLPSNASDAVLSEEFASFFIEKVEKIRDNLQVFPAYEPEGLSTSMFDQFKYVDINTVKRLIMNAKAATCQSDPLPSFLVKKYVDIVGPVIMKIINLSLTSGEFFSEWKTSIVKPLIKKMGQDLVKTNYRPISNLPFISKLTEKAALAQFLPYTNAHNLLPSYQSAYRKNYSTETAVVKVVSDILMAMEHQKLTAFVSMDLSAAFDTVDHDILLEVLNRNFGISGSAMDWFKSYLSNRKMKVKVNNTESSLRSINSSVPQGSVAGPILYSVYASTLPSAITNSDINIMGYADDHGLYSSFSSSDEFKEIDNLSETLSSVKMWMNSNRMKMNDSKTEFIYFGSRQQLQKSVISCIDINNCIVNQSSSIKYLGVVLDNHLSFHEHISTKCKIAAMNIQYIRSIRKYLSLSSTKQLMYSLVLSHLDYCNSLFIGLPETTLNIAQRIQNWAAKVALKRGRYDSSSKALFDLHWLPVRYRIDFKILLLVFKCINDLAPIYLQNMIVKRSSQRQTRSASVLTLEVPSTKCKLFADRSFSVYGPKLWNSLPNDLQNIKSVSLFRSNLKTYLFKKAFVQYLS